MQKQKKPKSGSPAAPAASPQALVRPDVSDVLNGLDTAQKRATNRKPQYCI